MPATWRTTRTWTCAPTSRSSPPLPADVPGCVAPAPRALEHAGRRRQGIASRRCAAACGGVSSRAASAPVFWIGFSMCERELKRSRDRRLASAGWSASSSAISHQRCCSCNGMAPWCCEILCTCDKSYSMRYHMYKGEARRAAQEALWQGAAAHAVHSGVNAHVFSHEGTPHRSGPAGQKGQQRARWGYERSATGAAFSLQAGRRRTCQRRHRRHRRRKRLLGREGRVGRTGSAASECSRAGGGQHADRYAHRQPAGRAASDTQAGMAETCPGAGPSAGVSAAEMHGEGARCATRKPGGLNPGGMLAQQEGGAFTVPRESTACPGRTARRRRWHAKAARSMEWTLCAPLLPNVPHA